MTFTTLCSLIIYFSILAIVVVLYYTCTYMSCKIIFNKIGTCSSVQIINTLFLKICCTVIEKSWIKSDIVCAITLCVYL